MDLGLSGLVSGLDWRTLVDSLADAERTPQVRLRTEQTTLGRQNAAYAAIQKELEALQNRVETLNNLALFDSRLAGTSNEAIGTAAAGTGTAPGTYEFNFIQLATAAKIAGASNAGQGISATNDVSSLVLADAGFAIAVKAGTITVNGKQVTIATTDTLQDVFGKISTATSGAVTGSYDAATDTMALTSASPIVLGSATDTSNFLTVAKLNNNGTGNITSSAALGSIQTSAVLSGANFGTPLADGAGEFLVNGVSITYDANTDTVADVLKRINDSAAGVVASYDSVNDRFVLTNKTTGDVGIALEDVTGNFLEATGLSNGALQRGKDLIYTLNNGGQLVSHSNTIEEDNHGVAGLSVNALKSGEGPVSITVGNDTEQIKTAIKDFIEQYNKVQSVIDTQTASSTDSDGKVTAGILANQSDASELATRLRRMVTGEIVGLSAALNQLEDMGIVSNGSDNSIKLEDEAKLDAALVNNLATVRSLFGDATTGLATKLQGFLDRTIGEGGSLITVQENNTKQSAGIDVQIADLERIVQSNRDRMIQSFIAMETAQAQINQQLQFLQQRFGTSSSSSAASSS